MSNYPPPGMQPVGYPPPGYPVQPPRSGCGCGGCLGKFFMLLGVICFLLLVATCGGLFYAVNHIKHAISERRPDVLEIAEEITPLQVPRSMEPVGAARIKFPLLGKLGQVAAFGTKDHVNAPDPQATAHESILIIGSFSGPLGETIKAQLVPALESGQLDDRPASGKSDEHNEELKDAKKTQVERTIRAEKAVFEISEGVGEKTGKKKIRVQGAFQGKTGPALLIVDADEEKVSRADVDEVIESIVKGGQPEK